MNSLLEKKEILERLCLLLKNPNGVAFKTIEIFNELFDEICFDVCLEQMKNEKRKMIRESQNSNDIFSNDISSSINEDRFPCDHCKRSVASSRFAPHLERCMLKSRRSTFTRQKSQKLSYNEFLNSPMFVFLIK